MKRKVKDILEKIEFDIIPVVCAIYLPIGFLLLVSTLTSPPTSENMCIICGLAYSLFWALPRATTAFLDI